MRSSRTLPQRWGLTGPHPNPLSDLWLVKPCGGAVSLHRYAGRWVVLRVTEQAADANCSVGDLPVSDFVALDVIAGPVTGSDAQPSLMFDPNHAFAHRFPALEFPAVFVIDPEGRLIAILDDHGWPEFLEELVRQTGTAPAHGAIDQQDIRHR